MTSEPLRWGIIGPGGIARAFAGGVAHSRTGKLVAIATRDPQRPGLADAYLVPQLYAARRFNVPLEAYPRILRVEMLAEAHPAFQAAHPARQADAAG